VLSTSCSPVIYFTPPDCSRKYQVYRNKIAPREPGRSMASSACAWDEQVARSTRITRSITSAAGEITS